MYDTMQFVKCSVATYCVGQAASLGALLLCAGTKGKRFTLPNSRIMIHQPWGGVQGTAEDISIQTNEILRLRTTVNQILSRHTGKPIAKVQEDTDRDFFMSAQEAKDYGIVDEVVGNNKAKKTK
jgi:ATP-dependent Clp protease protease subunit